MARVVRKPNLRSDKEHQLSYLEGIQLRGAAPMNRRQPHILWAICSDCLCKGQSIMLFDMILVAYLEEY